MRAIEAAAAATAAASTSGAMIERSTGSAMLAGVCPASSASRRSRFQASGSVPSSPNAGLESSRASERTRAGWRRAVWSAICPPIERPATCACVSPSVSMRPATASASAGNESPPAGIGDAP